MVQRIMYFEEDANVLSSFMKNIIVSNMNSNPNYHNREE